LNRYPFTETLGSTESAEQKRLKTILDDDFAGFAVALAASFDNHEAPDYCYDAVLAAMRMNRLSLNGSQGWDLERIETKSVC